VKFYQKDNKQTFKCNHTFLNAARLIVLIISNRFGINNEQLQSDLPKCSS
ncbi:5453_t:CDS:2, partial [Cetraspora pellucida]